MNDLKGEVKSRFMVNSKTRYYYVDEAGEYIRQRNEVDSSYRYKINELYDFLIRQLFRDRLHQNDDYEIHFAKRGKADRTAALRLALETARQRFTEKWGKTSAVTINVLASNSESIAGLQAADYFSLGFAAIL
jgi:hypothetical protein